MWFGNFGSSCCVVHCCSGFWKRRLEPNVVFQRQWLDVKMVTEVKIICKQNIPMLDVKKYHLRVVQEHNVNVKVIEVSPTSNGVPVFGHVRVSSESVSTETTRFESVSATGFPFTVFWIFFISEISFIGFWFCFYSVRELSNRCFVLPCRLYLGTWIGGFLVFFFVFLPFFVWIIVHQSALIYYMWIYEFELFVFLILLVRFGEDQIFVLSGCGCGVSKTYWGF